MPSVCLMPSQQSQLSGMGEAQALGPDRSFFFFLYFFNYFERESVCVHMQACMGRGCSRERGGERIPSRLHAISAEPDSGFDITKCEIMT